VLPGEGYSTGSAKHCHAECEVLIMVTVRGDEDVAFLTAELLRDVADELWRDGIEMRFTFGHEHGMNPVIDAWYRLNPGRVAVVECDGFGLFAGTSDCLATTIRERLLAAASLPEDRQTWDHTGTLWPD
jgi:hypothetical protein